MKTSKIVGIICWSLVAVLLAGVLITTLLGGNIMGNSFKLFSFSTTSYENLTTAEKVEIHTADINNLDIDWSAGYVNVVPYDGTDIVLEEKSSRPLNDNEKMTYKTEGNTLSVQYKAINNFWSFFSFDINVKSLDVKIPVKFMNNLENLKISSASADILTDNINAKTMDISTASGNLSISQCTVNIGKASTVSGNLTTADYKADVDMNISTTSGNINMNGNNQSKQAIVNTTSGNARVNITGDTIICSSVSGTTTVTGAVSNATLESVSGELTLNTLEICPKEIKMNTTSGDMDISLEKATGFTATFESVSGGFNSSYATINDGNRYIYEDGSTHISMKSISGSGSISK